MGVHIVIAGGTQCPLFAQLCLLADYLKQNLPNFCYVQIQKSVLEWQSWLQKINEKNKWHHIGSPIVWKEMLMKGSKAYYIGGAPEFLEYCHSYYNFDFFFAPEKFKGLVDNYVQYKKKEKQEIEHIATPTPKDDEKNNFSVCISGARNPITLHLVSGLLDMSLGEINISKILIFDSKCSKDFMELVQNECGYIGSDNPGKVVKVVDKFGAALTNTDLLIILDHVPFNYENSIGDWLHENKKIMKDFSLTINASASRKMKILFPNLGPACYNATVLMNAVNAVYKNNIAVATSDLGLEVLPFVAEIAEIPLRNIFCPPVWGFVGVNHLVDIRTTIHKYNSFEPYTRHLKVKNSSLKIGSLTAEMRTMEYLMYFDDSLWKKVANQKEKTMEDVGPLNTVISLLNITKFWLFGANPNNVVNLGIRCDGSFGLSFDGAFSQPARLKNGQWIPANEYMLPKDAQMKLPYFEEMARIVMKIKKHEMPCITPQIPCCCIPKYYKKKDVW